MRGLGAILALAAVSCGSRSGLPVAAEQRDGGDRPSDALCEQPLVSTTQPEAVGRACAFDGSTEPGWAAIVGTTLVFVDGNATPKPVHEFFVDAPGTTPLRAYVTSRGKYLGALLVGYVSSNTDQQRFEAVLFDTQGNLLARDAFNGTGQEFGPSGIFGNDAGVFVYAYGRSTGGVALGLLSASGQTLRPVNGIVPRGDPGMNWKLPVVEQNDAGSYGPVAWFDPCTGKRVPARGGQATVGAYSMGSRIAYFDYQSETLFDEGPDDRAQLSVADLGGANPKDWSPSGWVLLSTAQPFQFVIANVALGQKRVIDLAKLPPGFSLLNPLDGGVTPTGVRVTSSGDFVVPLRNVDHASLFLNRAGEWTELGTPVGEVYGAGTLGHQGSYMMYAQWQPVVAGWPPPQGPRLDGTSTQLVRPDTNVSTIVEFAPPSFGYTQTYQLSSDGGCLSYYDTYIDNTAHVVSAVSGLAASIDLSAFENQNWVFASTWIQGEDLVFTSSWN